MDNPFAKNVVVLMETRGIGSVPTLTSLTPCFNPVTGIPLFYAEIKQIRINPQKSDLEKEENVPIMKGLTVRVLVWQEGHMNDYFSGSDEAISKWKTTVGWLMSKFGYKFVIFNFDEHRPIQKITFSKNMVLTTPTLAPEVTCTAITKLTSALEFVLPGQQQKNVKYDRGMRFNAIARVPIFQYMRDCNDFVLKNKDGEMIAKRANKNFSNRRRLHFEKYFAKNEGKKEEDEEEKEDEEKKEYEEKKSSDKLEIVSMILKDRETTLLRESTGVITDEGGSLFPNENIDEEKKEDDEEKKSLSSNGMIKKN